VSIKIKIKIYEEMEQPGFVEPHFPIWRCYECGSTEVFSNVYGGWTGELKVICLKCSSDYTFPDGEGLPVCECGEVGWDCWKCNKFCCEKCWEWFDKREYHEEEEYICNKCK
jgi:hypothetical protein